MKFTVSLKNNRDFRWLYSRGKSAVGACLAVYSRRGRQNALRLGITVSSKLGNAVRRNRVRRRIKEAYRLNEERFLPGHDIVIVARVRAQTAAFRAISDDLLKQAAKLGLLRQD